MLFVRRKQVNVLKDRLNLTLLSAKVTQAELARIAGMGASHVNDICRGKRTAITAETVVRMARVLGCTTDWLLGLTPEGPAPAAVRQSVASYGGRVLEAPGSRRIRDPINVNAGTRSMRGRVRSTLVRPIDVVGSTVIDNSLEVFDAVVSPEK